MTEDSTWRGSWLAVLALSLCVTTPFFSLLRAVAAGPRAPRPAGAMRGFAALAGGGALAARRPMPVTHS